MNQVNAIRLSGISKKYRLFASPKERFKEAFHPFKKKYHREFWALKDISFDVPKGRTFGIVGRNGSGKSTLLQIISSVLTPTAGEIEVDGRISALLELGTGFNPELPGRENVIFNGGLNGFSTEEMKARVPRIEAFADIGEFFDQPVKFYSSGMFVRLAFAAAISTDPDILIIDEALSVGDTKFQYKCFERFRQLQDAGITILLVTHDTNAITRHCDSAVIIENGRVAMNGEPGDVVHAYKELMFTGQLHADVQGGPVADDSADEDERARVETVVRTELDRFLEEMPAGDNCPSRRSYNKNEHRFGDGLARVVDYLVVRGDDFDATAIYSGDEVQIYVKVRVQEDLESPLFGLGVKTVDGVILYGFNTMMRDLDVPTLRKGSIVVCKFSLRLDLYPGDYFFDLGVAKTNASTDELSDIRYGLFHLSVSARRRFDGLTDLDAVYEEVSRVVVDGTR